MRLVDGERVTVVPPELVPDLAKPIRGRKGLPKVPSDAVSEAEFQRKVIKTAKLYGWLVQHTRPSQVGNGTWVTAIQGHIGFPDLVLAHPFHGVVFAELKKNSGVLSAEQKQWLRTLTEGTAGLDKVFACVWRPVDWDDVKYILENGPAGFLKLCKATGRSV